MDRPVCRVFLASSPCCGTPVCSFLFRKKWLPAIPRAHLVTIVSRRSTHKLHQLHSGRPADRLTDAPWADNIGQLVRVFCKRVNYLLMHHPAKNADELAAGLVAGWLPVTALSSRLNARHSTPSPS